MNNSRAAAIAIAVVFLQLGCGDGHRNDDSGQCGPARGFVTDVIDGDTIELSSGDTVRYLLVDTPEVEPSTGGNCFAAEAERFNRDLVLGREIALRYDIECRDRYGRLLAHASVGAAEVNARLVERGYACVLHIPPNGDSRSGEFTALQERARAEKRGMWGVCEVVACAQK